MRIGQLFGPVIRKTNLREITSIEEYDAVVSQGPAIIFKHSPYCDISQAAYQTVVSFCSTNPAHTVFVISVPRFREVAVYAEKQTGVRHESPQVLAIRNGVVFAHASHRRLNADFLSTICLE